MWGDLLAQAPRCMKRGLHCHKVPEASLVRTEPCSNAQRRLRRSGRNRDGLTSGPDLIKKFHLPRRCDTAPRIAAKFCAAIVGMSALVEKLRAPAGSSRTGQPSEHATQRLHGDVFSHIAALEPELSRAHRAIAMAILSSPREFVEKPIEDLAAWIGVSAPTITRFARVVGCEGLRSLKLKVMSGLRVGLRYLEPPAPPGDTAEVVSRAVRRAQHAIATAAHMLNTDTLERAADRIGITRTLYVFGSGGVSSWLIDEIQNRLFRLGIMAVPSRDHVMQMMLAATVTRHDTVLCCSLTGRNAELLRAASIAREYGAVTLALTAEASALAAAVDLALTIPGNDHSDVFGATSLRYSSLVMIDALAYLVALHNSRSAQQTLRRIKQQFIRFRDSDDRSPLCD